MQEEHEPSPGLFGIKPKKKLRWRKREPDPKRRFRPRRKEAADTSKAKGEYTTQKMLAVMAHIVANPNEYCTVKDIAKGAKISKKHGGWDAVGAGEILRRLKKRCLVEKNAGRKKAKKITDPDTWSLTRAGEKHFYAELHERYYTPTIEALIRDGEWKRIVHLLTEIRTVLVPQIKALEPFGEHAHAIYRIDLLWRTRSLSYLKNVLKLAPKAFNPAAYFVSCCMGSLWDCNMKRARAWAAKRRFFVKHPELLEVFLFTIDKPKIWVDPFEYAKKAYNAVELACNMSGNFTREFMSMATGQASMGVNGPRKRKPA